jgi:hypothetical protein
MDSMPDGTQTVHPTSDRCHHVAAMAESAVSSWKDEGGSVALNPPFGGMKDEQEAFPFVPPLADRRPSALAFPLD